MRQENVVPGWLCLAVPACARLRLDELGNTNPRSKKFCAWLAPAVPDVGLGHGCRLGILSLAVPY